MEQIFSPSDSGFFVHFPFFLRASFYVLSRCVSFPSPDSIKEAIVSLVVPADSLPACTWISCWAGFVAGENFLSSSSKDFKLHIQ